MKEKEWLLLLQPFGKDRGRINIAVKIKQKRWHVEIESGSASFRWTALVHCSMNWVQISLSNTANCSSASLTDHGTWWTLLPMAGHFFPKKCHQTNFRKSALEPTPFLTCQGTSAEAAWGRTWQPGAGHWMSCVGRSRGPGQASAGIRTHQFPRKAGLCAHPAAWRHPLH